MKKMITILAAGMALIAACGPSAEDKAAIEQAVLDSISTAQQAYDDSMATVAAQDSVDAMMEQIRLDSIAMADSLAMLQSKLKSASAKPRPKPQPKKEEPKTIGSGKPAMGTGSTGGNDSTIGKGKPRMGGK